MGSLKSYQIQKKICFSNYYYCQNGIPGLTNHSVWLLSMCFLLSIISLQIFGIKFFNVKCSVKSLIEKGSLESTSALDV